MVGKGMLLSVGQPMSVPLALQNSLVAMLTGQALSLMTLHSRPASRTPLL